MAGAKLTRTQQEALVKIREAGTFHCFNGISAATVGVLERAGLIEVTWSQRTWTNYRSRRTHHQRNWTATAKSGEVH